MFGEFMFTCPVANRLLIALFLFPVHPPHDIKRDQMEEGEMRRDHQPAAVYQGLEWIQQSENREENRNRNRKKVPLQWKLVSSAS